MDSTDGRNGEHGAISSVFPKRLMELEPTIFCMAISSSTPECQH
jgi:hypothetical protein